MAALSFRDPEWPRIIEFRLDAWAWWWPWGICSAPTPTIAMRRRWAGSCSRRPRLRLTSDGALTPQPTDVTHSFATGEGDLRAGWPACDLSPHRAAETPRTGARCRPVPARPTVTCGAGPGQGPDAAHVLAAGRGGHCADRARAVDRSLSSPHRVQLEPGLWSSLYGNRSRCQADAAAGQARPLPP